MLIHLIIVNDSSWNSKIHGIQANRQKWIFFFIVLPSKCFKGIPTGLQVWTLGVRIKFVQTIFYTHTHIPIYTYTQTHKDQCTYASTHTHAHTHTHAIITSGVHTIVCCILFCLSQFFSSLSDNSHAPVNTTCKSFS